jgi:hypothetical protein
MKSCPGCTFLVDDDAEDCRYCGVSTVDVAAGTVAAPAETRTVAVRKETVSTRLTAAVIVVASLSVVGVGAWAFHHSPAPDTAHHSPIASAPESVVHYQKVTLTTGIAFHLDVAVGATAPDLSNGVVSMYGTGRELDVVHIAAGGGTDLTAILSTFSAGWPSTQLHTSTTPVGQALSFVLTNDTQLTHGTLIDGGTNGIFLLAVKAPLGSTMTPVDRAVLARAVSTLRVGP